MDFEEWFKSHRYSDVPLCYGAAKDAFEAGQQSKQAEIDALQEMYIKQWLTIEKLQKRIDEALDVFKSDLSEIGKFDTIHKILKGELK